MEEAVTEATATVEHAVAEVAQGAQGGHGADTGLTAIAFVIVVAVTAGLGLMRLRQPPLVGFILAGVLLEKMPGPGQQRVGLALGSGHPLLKNLLPARGGGVRIAEECQERALESG